MKNLSMEFGTREVSADTQFGDGYQAVFKIGVQTFFSLTRETKQEAEWYSNNLKMALLPMMIKTLVPKQNILTAINYLDALDTFIYLDRTNIPPDTLKTVNELIEMLKIEMRIIRDKAFEEL